MKILNTIRNFFTKKVTPTESIFTKVEFALGDNFEANVKLIVTDTSEDAADYFADLLYGINRGEYIENILQILVDMGNQDQSIHDFVQRVISQWSLIEKMSEKKYAIEPQVKPTDFFQGLKNGT